jgi:hypothetical protein
VKSETHKQACYWLPRDLVEAVQAEADRQSKKLGLSVKPAAIVRQALEARLRRVQRRAVTQSV